MSEPSGEMDREAREQFIRLVLAGVPEAQRQGPQGGEISARVTALADAVIDAQRYHRDGHAYRDEDLQRINEAAARVRELDAGFTLTDVDVTTGARLSGFFLDARSLLARVTGRLGHEGEWNGERWTNWNFEFECVPGQYAAPAPALDGDAYAPVRDLVRAATALRVVGAGHSFNEATSTGGTRGAPAGTLVSLDRYDRWEVLPAEEVTRRWGVTGDQAARVVRVQAGKRLRDFSSALWSAGLAMPLAGSTDAQSLGGLLATDLHGTGRDHGFLSEQLLEVRLVTGEGALVTITRTPEGWVTDESPPRSFRWLPVAGAIGVLGVVVELTLKADRAYYLRHGSRYIARADAENDLEALLGQHDHMSFYYVSGERNVSTIRMNTWDRTTDTPGLTAGFSRLAHEVTDHALGGMLPGSVMQFLGSRDARTDPLVGLLNADPPAVLPAPEAFARRLFYVHDELEYGLPISEFRTAVTALMDLLADEEFETIVELRFTPDSSVALLGPGTAGRGKGGTAFFEMATAFEQHTKLRIAEVYEKLHRLFRDLGGRPHLGKKTAVTAAEMAAMYGADWDTFQALRRAWDPQGKLIPRDNLFLSRVFGG